MFFLLSADFYQNQLFSNFLPGIPSKCLFDLILYIPSTIFQLNTGTGLPGLNKDHNAVTPVRLEPAASPSRVKNSTTEPLCSHTIRVSNSLDPDQARHFVRPDLGSNCLQWLSADEASRGRVICLIWFFTSQSTIFQLCRDGSSWVEPVLS